MSGKHLQFKLFFAAGGWLFGTDFRWAVAEKNLEPPRAVRDHEGVLLESSSWPARDGRAERTSQAL